MIMRTSMTPVLTLIMCLGCSDMGTDGTAELMIPDSVARELTFVVSNGEDFAFDADDPLLERAPGVVVDDLNDMDGCWGVALLGPSLGGAENLFSLYHVFRFDKENGTLTSWLLQTGALGSLALATEQTGTYELQDGNLLIEQYDSIEVIWATAEDLPVSELSARSLESVATLDGNRLRLRYGSADREPSDPLDESVYLQFDCPAD